MSTASLQGVRFERMDGLRPDGYYRPIPIVWIAALIAAFGPVLGALYLINFLWLKWSGWTLATFGAIWLSYLVYRTWPRKLAQAAIGWRIAALLAVGLQYGLFTLGAFNQAV